MKIVSYDTSYKVSVYEFTSRCFEELGKRFEPEGRHSFYEDIEGHFDVFFCLVDSGKIVGTAACKRIDDDTAELKALYLESSLRGQGLGASLLDKVIDHARKNGYKRIVLDSMSKYEAALRLYERAGFVMTERYNDNPCADIFMQLEL
ncbi:MAG: GNAT family N-acetyltransferase [Clostridiales bacterium]|nr:GNAT family N-acetyltransferase [Clostridiales bacterium]